MAGALQEYSDQSLALNPSNPVEKVKPRLSTPEITPQIPETPLSPYIRVVVSEDSMVAHLFIYPPEGAKVPASHEAVLTAIRQKGVVYGLEMAAVTGAVDTFNAQFRPVMQALIAKGTHPQPGKNAVFEPAVEFLVRAAFQIRFPEIPLPPDEAKFARVDGPGLLGWITPETKGTPGSTVLGKKIPAESGAAAIKVLQPIAQEKQGERIALRVRAACALQWTESQLRTIPIPKAKAGKGAGEAAPKGALPAEPSKPQIPVLSLVIAENHMAAWLTLRPPEGRSVLLDSKAVTAWLRKGGLRYGIDGAAVSSLVQEYNQAPNTIEQRLVAQGILPQNGDDALLELAIPFTPRSVFHKDNPDLPMPEPVGEEFYALVEEKTLLARIKSETRGKAGITVKGLRLAGRNGVNPFRAGSGALSSRSERGAVLTAKIGGIAIRRGNEFRVIDLPKPQAESEKLLAAIPEVEISPDLLSASLSIHPPEGPSRPLDYKYLAAFLKQKGVRVGLKEGALREIIERYNSHPQRIPPQPVAAGMPMTPGTDARLEVAHGFVDQPTFLRAHPGRPIPEGFPDRHFKLVNPGEIVAVLVPETRGKNGMTVGGVAITAMNGSNPFTMRGGLVPRRTEGRVELIARLTGLAVHDGNAVAVIEYQHVGVQVRLEEDDFKASCQLLPPAGLCLPLQVQEVHEAIKRAGVSYGVAWKTIDQEVLAYQAQPGLRQFICAIGDRPENGLDGRLDFLIDIDLRPVLTPDPNGRIDYRFQRNLILVKAGMRVATVTPPTPGTKHGVTVRARDVRAEDGKPVRLTLFDGLTETEDRGVKVITASKDGELSWDSKRAEMRVSSHKTVEAVDLALGNLKFIGNVTVQRNIEDGMTVEVEGDLIVKGMVLGAKVTVDGNLACEGGIITKEGGFVTATKDVRARFVENSTIKAGGAVVIERAILHSRVYSLETITAISARSFVIGGVLVGREGVSIHHLGNSAGARSLVHLGSDWRELEQYLELGARLKGLREDALRIDQEIQRVAKAVGGKIETLTPAQKQVYRGLLQRKGGLIKDFRARREEAQALLARIEDVSDADLSVLGYVFPDNTVRFGNTKHITTGNMQKVRFLFEKENREIRFASLKSDPVKA
ncbi:MAG: DUF342 domain-containing protein [Spirochaetes bacterium]|nr:DUF342 domain-containing protein [Spirochaetota bacterium]